MSAWRDETLDFRRLKRLVTIDRVLDAYGLGRTLIKRANTLCGPCPLHHGDHPTAFRADLNRGIWNCFTRCARGGDVVDLVRVIERCSFARAARILRDLAGETNGHQYGRSATRSADHQIVSRNPPFRPFRRRVSLNPATDFLQRKKLISVDTAAYFEAGHPTASAFLRGTVAVRLHDLAGRPLGYAGRRLREQDIRRYGKWRFPRGMPKAEMLFNAHRARHLRRNGLVLVECPWAVMRLTQAGVPAAVALLGTNISPIQLAWLARADQVVLMLDGDDAGRKGAQTIRRHLAPSTKIKTVELPDGLEPEDLSDDDLRAGARHAFLF